MPKKKHGYNILAGLFGGLGGIAKEYARLKEKKGDSEEKLLEALSMLSLKQQLGENDPYKQALTAETQARTAQIGQYPLGQSPQEVLDLYGKKKKIDKKYAKPDKPLMTFGDFLKAKDQGRFKFGKLAMPLPPIGDLFKEYQQTVGGAIAADAFDPAEIAKIAAEEGMTEEEVIRALSEE